MHGKLILREDNKSLDNTLRFLEENEAIDNNRIIYILINISDAEKENLSEGDIIAGYEIKFSKHVMPGYLWFIEDNKSEIRPKLENKGE